MNASQALISRRGSLMSTAQVGGLRKHPFGRVDQLEDRYLGMVEAPSSNLGTSTSSLHIDGYEVNVRHGFRRYNEVKPLARHVHQKRLMTGLVAAPGIGLPFGPGLNLGTSTKHASARCSSPIWFSLSDGERT